MKPYFSIVIPTKDRPEYVSIALESIERQDFGDYEVVISDNAASNPCKSAIARKRDARLKYFRNERSLGMCDSFEAAIRHANGKWVMVLGDKSILYPDALGKLYKAIEKNQPEIINFSQDWLKPINAEKDLVCGKLSKKKKTGGTYWADTQKALRDHLSCHQLFGGTDDLWYIGCILYGGVYAESFIGKVRGSHESGRFFEGVVPDRYGAVDALCKAEKVLFLDDNITIYNTSRSDKHTWNSVSKKGLDEINAFVRESRRDVDYTESLLIPGVTASVNNILASDYLNAAINGTPSDSADFIKKSIDVGYLAALVENDLSEETGIDDAVLSEQKSLLERYIGQMSDSDKAVFDASREQIKKSKKERRRKSLFGLKPFVDRMLGKGILSDNGLLQSVCTTLENILSKNITVIKSLSDIC